MTTARELLAKAAHDEWATWQRYADQIRLSTEYNATMQEVTDEPLETIEISEKQWDNWNRKAFLEFEELTPKEQVSDYEIADKILIPAFEKWLIEQKDSQTYTDWKATIDVLLTRLNKTKPTEEKL